MESEKKRTRLIFFLSFFLLVFQVFISHPIAIWKANTFNVDAPLTHSTAVVLVFLMAITILAIISSVIIPLIIQSKSQPILLILTLILFIQQNFLTWDYGILDGLNLNFDKNNGLGIIDITLWLSGFVIAIFAGRIIRKQTANILLGIGAATVVMTGVNILGYEKVSTPYSIDEAAKYDFSSEENIIVLLFDAYQMDLFLEIADKYPNLIEPFDGFTLYENNSAVFAKTYPTIPLFLTGRRYNKQEPILDFFKTAYEDSYLQDMKANGWDIGLYPNIKSYPSLVNAVDVSPKTMDNVVGGISNDAKLTTYLRVLNLSLFRSVPHQIKPNIYNNGNFVFKDNVKWPTFGKNSAKQRRQPFTYKSKQRHGALAFRDLMNEHGKLNTSKPVLRFFHFAMPHAPNSLDKDLNRVKHTESFGAYREYSIAAVKLMGAYLESLKSIGAYDNATILIVSDHGMGVRHKFQYDFETRNYKTLDKFALHRSAAKSLVLIKEPLANGRMKRSQKPVSGIDIAPTIANAANLPVQDFEGLTISDIADSANRPRLFNFYGFSTWDSKYLNYFEQFEINGDVRDDDAWTLLGKLRGQVDFKNKATYVLSETLSFGNDVKSDSDFLNAFIEEKNYTYRSSHIAAEDGIIDLDIQLEKPLTSADHILLQFEIYSGAAKPRKISVNGSAFETYIKPRKRFLNRGYHIPPSMHKNLDVFKLSFQPLDPATTDTLRLSSVKLSQFVPELVTPNENLIKNIDKYYPVSSTRQNSKKELSIDKSLSLVFVASKNLCQNHKLMLDLKSENASSVEVLLNNAPIEASPKGSNISEGRLIFNCKALATTQPNILKITHKISRQVELDEGAPKSLIITNLRFEKLPDESSK